MTLPGSHKPYIGRFAPTPSGPLHLGSLFSALASYLQARSNQGQWLLRIEDIDRPRIVSGAADSIIKTLDRFGLHWDQSVYYQSTRIEAYQAALDTLQQQNLLYPCSCSRKSLQHYYREHPEQEAVYPGFCRKLAVNWNKAHAVRIKTDACDFSFVDALQGKFSENLAVQQGDFIIKRRDAIFAYQLAVVVDDHIQQITEIVRGYDILSSTSKQIFLQQKLALTTPDYMHIPVIVNPAGVKLSKQTGARPVDSKAPEQLLFTLLQLLKQNPPLDINNAPVREQLEWAISNWNPEHLKVKTQINEPVSL